MKESDDDLGICTMRKVVPGTRTPIWTCPAPAEWVVEFALHPEKNHSVLTYRCTACVARTSWALREGKMTCRVCAEANVKGVLLRRWTAHRWAQMSPTEKQNRVLP